MNRRHPVIVLLLLSLAACPAGALAAPALSSAPVPAPVVAVEYTRSVPPAVRARVPRGGTSLFYGGCRLARGGPRLWLHFYRTPQLVKRAGIIGGEQQQPVHRVDFYSGARGGGKLFHSIEFGFYGQDLRTAVDILWVDPKTRKIPLVRIHTFTPNNFYSGTNGTYTLLSIARGWHGPATVQHFDHYWHTSGSRDVAFDAVDERGLTRLLIHGWEYEEKIADLWRWDGTRFVAPAPRPTPTPYTNQP